MSAWVLGLALGAGYLINKNVQVSNRLQDSVAEYQSTAEPADEGVTSEEVRKAWMNTDSVRNGDFAEEIPRERRASIQHAQQMAERAVQQFEAPTTQPIEGVLMTFSGCAH